MSHENVEVVQAVLEAWQRDDFEAFLSGTDPAIEWHTVRDRLVEGAESFYRGHEGIRRAWRFFRTEFENFEIEVQELRAIGDDRVVLLGRVRWRRRDTGNESEASVGMAITVRHGRMIQSNDYLDHQEALTAVGVAG